MPGFLENAGGEVGMSLLMLIMYHMAGWEESRLGHADEK